MTHVGINLLWLVPGAVGGSESYLARCLNGVAERRSGIDYTLFALPAFGDAHPDVARAFRTVYAPVDGASRARRVAAESSWLALQCRRRALDVAHHAGGTIPPLHWGRPIVTVHDLQYLYFPEYFGRAKLAYLTAMVPRSVRSAAAVLTPSNYVRRTVIERLGVRDEDVMVVPHGISPRPQKEPAHPVRELYGLRTEFFLYPAITYPHKNHVVLIEALARVVKNRPMATLVLTGGPGSYQGRLERRIAKLGLGAHVKRLGYIPAADLDALYHEAVALTFPSRFEGFGAPVLEAMSRGCPVIAANAAALPEVVGEAGRLLPADDADEWARHMTELLEDSTARGALAKAGRERAAEFTWARSADALEGAYEKVVSAGR